MTTLPSQLTSGWCGARNPLVLSPGHPHGPGPLWVAQGLLPLDALVPPLLPPHAAASSDAPAITISGGRQRGGPLPGELAALLKNLNMLCAPPLSID